MHGHQDAGVDPRAEPRGLAVVEVADDASSLPLGVSPVDGQQRDVDPERREQLLHAVEVDRVAGVVDPHAPEIDDEPDEADEPVRQRVAEPVRVIHRHAVTRGDRADRQAADVDRFAGLHPHHPIRRDARFRDHVDDRGRDHERGARRCGRDGPDAWHVQMIDVLVGAEHDVDAHGLLGRQRRVVEASVVRGEERVEQHGDAAAASREARLPEPGQRGLSITEADGRQAFDRGLGHRDRTLSEAVTRRPRRSRRPCARRRHARDAARSPGASVRPATGGA